MAMVIVDGSSLYANSESKSTGLAWVLMAIWHWVCIYHMNS